MNNITSKSSLVTDFENDGLAHLRRPGNISKMSIQNIAIEKYQASGYGIRYIDVMKAFSVSKGQAQRTLKHFHHNKVLFTARDLIDQGIDLLENKNPQQYFPTYIKGDILERLKEKETVTQ